jgi:hypothetical protein
VDANVESAWQLFRDKGFTDDTILARLTTFAPVARGEPVESEARA